MSIVRELGAFEVAQVISEKQGPFHIVGVVQLERGPSPSVLRESLAYLQQRHPFLSVRVVEKGRRLFFDSLPEHSLPFTLIERKSDEHWIEEAESALSIPLDRQNGLMFRCSYLYSRDQPCAEIVLTISHIISDAASVNHLIHEMLKICASLMDGKPVSVFRLSPVPALEARFPSAFLGWRMTFRKLRYIFAQMSDEILYRIRTHGTRTPQVPNEELHSHILSLVLDEELLEQFSRRARKAKVTLNSALNAVLLLAVNRQLYGGQSLPMRTFTFANLRPYVEPPLEDENLGLYISLLRYTMNVAGGMDLWSLARDLHDKIQRSLRTGEKYVTAVMSESLLKMLDRMQTVRMCASALNYSGVVPVRTEYEGMKVSDIHGFISPLKFGPEFSAEAQLFDGRLFLDFIYAEADMDRQKADAIVQEIKEILNSSLG